jgi:hypothetical protein
MRILSNKLADLEMDISPGSGRQLVELTKMLDEMTCIYISHSLSNLVNC